MSAVTVAGAGRADAAWSTRAAPVVAAAFAMSVLLSWPRLVDIWTVGRFYDTDDAMRMVQVRAWLAGQGWFDLVAHRLHPPAGLLMHWSRVVDVPVGGLVLLFGLFASPDRAETLARIAFPLVLQLALIGATVHLGRVVAGPRAAWATAVLVVASAFMFEQFPPGRIDHHAPQITLLVLMTAAVLGSLEPGRARAAALGASALAVSLAISLENLPFAAVLVAVLPLAWLVRPSTARAPMLWFAGGLAICAPLAFIATVPPQRYLDPAVDAYSIVHLTAAVLGAGGLACLALLTPRLRNPARRWIALTMVGGTVLGLTVVLFPACLRGPYAGMDPLVRRLWLSRVTEAQPLLVVARKSPGQALTLFCPLFAGALAALVAALREAGVARMRWVAVAGLALVGLAGTCWEVRVATSAQPLTLLGGAWAVARATGWAQRRGAAWRTALRFGLLLPFSVLAWAVATPLADPTTVARDGGMACRTPAAVSALAALPPGTVFAPIDDGAHILAHTDHAVVAGPYHRNAAGNRTVLDGFLADPDREAEPIVRATGARSVALCPLGNDVADLVREAPHGLAAALVAGRIPAWLRPVPLNGTPFIAFATTGAE